MDIDNWVLAIIKLSNEDDVQVIIVVERDGRGIPGYIKIILALFRLSEKNE